MTAVEIFSACSKAILAGNLIVRESAQDKEFHFQNWFKDRLSETGLQYEQGGRNSYPDFRLVAFQDGFEIKGLAYPGRDANFDSNSQVPTGFHNGRNIYYVFGRYPAKPDGDRYPVVDLVVCHGDFLNADHEYTHKNRNVKGFGTYGDVMIRDRKMYVVPTPFHLVHGTAHQHTLILPESVQVGANFRNIGTLTRVEAANLVVGYDFDLKTNDLGTRTIKNSQAGRRHSFRAWRLKDAPSGEAATMRTIETVKRELEREIGDED